MIQARGQRTTPSDRANFYGGRPMLSVGPMIPDLSIDQTPLSYQTYYDPRPKPTNPEPPYNENSVYQKSKSKASYTQSGRSYTMSALDQKTTVSFILKMT